MLTKGELSELASLQERLGAKFGEIVQFFAAKLGPDADHRAEAEEALEMWEEADVDYRVPVAADMSPLQRLLGEHQEIQELILDIQDSLIARVHVVEDLKRQ
jgi:hypothetical protein